MSDFIEKGIPMPHERGANPESVSGKLRSLAAAEIGDSIVLQIAVGKIGGYLRAPGQPGCGWYTARTVEGGGIRVWKKSEPKKRDAK